MTRISPPCRRAMLKRDPGPGVLEGGPHPRVVGFQGNPKPPARGADGIGGIDDQIGEDLLQLAFVSHDQDVFARRFPFQFDLVLLEPLLE